MKGHNNWVFALVGGHNKVFSGSSDQSIKVDLFYCFHYFFGSNKCYFRFGMWERQWHMYIQLLDIQIRYDPTITALFNIIIHYSF